MKKGRCLNSEISYRVACLGHFDTIGIGDAGMPIPPETDRVDLAVCPGTPDFLSVLDTVLSEMKVQKVYLAEETREKNPELFEQLEARFDELGVEMQEYTHVQLKQMTKKCRCMIRTGECKPYANVILESGVTF